METNPITVVIVDDHAMTRAGVKVFIEQDERIKVIGEAKDGKEAITLCAELSPSVVIMDLYMPLVDGIEASKRIIADNPNIKIVMLTSSSGKEEVSAALSAGAKAYCLKDVNNERLTAAIHSVFNGDLWIDSSIADNFFCSISPEIAQNGRNHNGKSHAGQGVNFSVLNMAPQHEATQNGQQVVTSLAANRFSLTEREIQVLNLLVSGKTNQEIASELFLSVDTIKSHLKTIMSKLDVNDRTHAAVKAVREGLIL